MMIAHPTGAFAPWTICDREGARFFGCPPGAAFSCSHDRPFICTRHVAGMVFEIPPAPSAKPFEKSRAALPVFKRGMKGVYQHCQEKHLHRYLAEFDFRYNNRVALGVDDVARSHKGNH